MAILESIVDEGQRIADAARQAGVQLRALGGVAVWMHCANRDLLSSRRYGDIDFVGRAAQTGDIEKLLESLAYEPNWTFNRLHKGDGRLMFFDRENERRVDVFLDRFSMCHALDLAERLSLDFPTLCLADLVLTKLQVVEITEKDLVDLTAVLDEHEVGQGNDETIDIARVTSVCSSDWGWYRTVLNNLQRIASGPHPSARGRAVEMIEAVDAAPKSRRWKVRAMVGERVPWYQLPERV